MGLGQRPPGYGVLFAVVLPTFLLALITGSAPILLPQFVEELSLRISDAGVLTAAYGLGRLLAGVLLGLVAARLPLVMLLFGNLGMTALGLELTAIASTQPLLALGRLLTGMGVGGVMFIALSVVLSRTAADARVRALSMLEMGIVVGIGLGAAGSGVLVSWLGWRSALQAMLGLVIVAALACGRTRRVWALSAVQQPASAMGSEKTRRGRAVPPFSRLGRLAPAYLTTFCLGVLWNGLLVTVFPLHGVQELRLSDSFVGSAVSMASWGELVLLVCMPLLLRHYGRTDIFAVSIAGMALGSVLLLVVRSPYVVAAVIWVLGMCFSAWIVPVSMLPELHGSRALPPWVLGAHRVSAELGGVIGPVALAALAEKWGFLSAGAAVSVAVGLSGFSLVRAYSRTRFEGHAAEDQS